MKWKNVIWLLQFLVLDLLLVSYSEIHTSTVPATNNSRLPFVDARYCKSSLNSSITSWGSWPKNLNRWNNPRSSRTSSGFIQSWNIQSLWVGLCMCTKPVFQWPSWISYQTAWVCTQWQANASTEQFTCLWRGGWYKWGPWWMSVATVTASLAAKISVCAVALRV